MIQTTRTSYTLLLPMVILSHVLPRALQVFFSKFIGSAIFRSMRGMREALVSNLTVVSGSRRQAFTLAHRTVINYSIYLVDYIQLPLLSRRAVEHRVGPPEGATNFFPSRESGRGAVLITPHLGNWEFGGVWLATHGYPINVLSLQDSDARTDAFRNRMRAVHGVRVLPFDPGSDSMTSMTELLSRLKNNEIVAMLTDRPSAQRTVTVPFFGRPSPLPVGPFLLSWLSGAPLLPSICVLRRQARYELLCDAPILLDRALHRDEAIRRGMEEMARRYETYIRRDPDQWYNFFPYWTQKQFTR